MCCCGSIGAPPTEVRICQEHHVYYRGDKELFSVSKVLKTAWPFKPDFSAAPAEVLENARERGTAVDMLFSAYVNGKLISIPAGTRVDAAELFLKLKVWWDKEYGGPGNGKSQVILADDQVAGTCDLLPPDERILDVKATYDVEAMYELQLGAYADLHFSQFQKPVKALGILHVTKRFREPKLIKIDMANAIKDWLLIRDVFFMAKRRTGK